MYKYTKAEQAIALAGLAAVLAAIEKAGKQ